jgi:hypothetical protein
MKDNIDETLVEWNKILEDIRGESKLLIKDLLEAIRYVAASGILMIILGSYVLFIGLRYGNLDESMFILWVVIATLPSYTIGFYNLYKYIQLRSRYNRLFEIQSKLDSE